jgi:hypothetical protein
MKYLLSIVLVIGFSCTKIQAQEASVERSIWGAQIIMLPLSVYNESKLTNEIALRSELSWGFSWSGGGYYDSSVRWEVIPYLIVEPRYYYNLNRRAQKERELMEIVVTTFLFIPAFSPVLVLNQIMSGLTRESLLSQCMV